jgi:hypothetical protein
MKVASLYRYPVKGLSPEPLTSVPLAAGLGFPLDRKYALLRTEAAFDPAAPAWLPKANFVILMLHEQVAGLQTRYSAQGEQLSVRTADGHERAFQLGTAAGRSALGRFFLEFILNAMWAGPQELPENYLCPDCGAGREACVPAEKFRARLPDLPRAVFVRRPGQRAQM